MDFKFDKKAIEEIEATLGVKFARRGNQFRAVVLQSELGRKLTIEIYSDILIGKDKGNLVSIFTPASHVQLHLCTGFVASEVLGEVTFFAENSNRISGIVVERQAACSTFTNVDASLLSGDFEQLAPEVMLSGIALSLTEPLLKKNLPE